MRSTFRTKSYKVDFLWHELMYISKVAKSLETRKCKCVKGCQGCHLTASDTDINGSEVIKTVQCFIACIVVHVQLPTLAQWQGNLPDNWVIKAISYDNNPNKLQEVWRCWSIYVLNFYISIPIVQNIIMKVETGCIWSKGFALIEEQPT